MTEEQYKRSCVIKKEIDLLEQHKADLKKARFDESTGCGLTYRFNDHHPEVRLLGAYIDRDFSKIYTEMIDNKIQTLKDDFFHL